MNRENSKRLLPHAREMRQVPPDAEKRLWSRLRNRRLDGLKFRRQQPIGPFIVDFACDEVRLVVELDGDQHFELQAEAYDASRTKKLEALGWRVIRFTTSDAVKDTDVVCESIVTAARPHPNPLPLSTTGEGTRL